MSTENPVEEKSRRRRKRRTAAEEEVEEVVDAVEEADEDEDDIDDDSARGVSERKGRATPGRRSLVAAEEKQTGNFVTRTYRSIREYFTGVRDELRKVTWPTPEEMRRLTVIVLGATITASIVLGLISLGFTELFVAGLNNAVVFFIFFAVVIGLYFAYTRIMARRRDISPY